MKREVAASFARAATGYCAHAGVQEAMADWLAEWLPARRAGRVLEVGAGPGVFTRRMLPWTGSIVATDAVAAMCEAGRNALPAVTWRVMRAEAPFPGPWDWIMASSMLQWIEAPDRMFAAWRSSLTPGGRVVGGLFVEPCLPELRLLTHGADPFAWRTRDAWRAALAAGGLRLVRDEMVGREFHYASARAFLASLHQVGAAPQRRLGFAAMRQLLREYETRFAVEGGVRATWTFYRFEACRDSG